jgi:hypothetical protein
VKLASFRIGDRDGYGVVEGDVIVELSAAPDNARPVPLPAASLMVAHPTYVSIVLEVAVDKSAAEVWARVGKFCDIGEWLQIAAGCTITSGKDGEVGAVRTVGGEVLVAKTDLSYAYTQTVAGAARQGRPYNLYHGNLEVKPLTPTTSRIVYTLMYDNSMLPDDAARARDLEQRRTTFMRAMNNMKILAEGGTLPPPPAAPPRPATPAAK